MTDKNLSTKPDDNYQNTPMGKAVQKKYADILHGSRPEPSYRHPRMTLSNRAKIFSPFAALRGYEEEIAAEGEEHLKVTKIKLSEEDKGKLSDKLLQVKKGMEVTVCFFETDNDPASFNTPSKQAAPRGRYRIIAGTVERIDPVYRELQFSTGDKNALGKELPVIIRFDDILDLSGDGIVDIDEYLGIEKD